MKAHTSVRRATTWTLVLAMLSVTLMFTWSAAGAAEIHVDAQAQVTSNNVPPVIDCKWELPDMQSDVPGMQYGTAEDPEQHDFDMDVAPDADPATPGNQIPCQGPEDGQTPSQPSGVRNMIQVLPNAEDEPEAIMVELWSLVSHENGISNISDTYWKIFHPDGSFKVQVHGTRVPTADCENYGYSDTPGSMFEAAVGTGQVSAAAVDDINLGIIARCLQMDKALYYAHFEISKEQPCGEYRIEAHAVSAGASAEPLVNYIDVFCFYHLEIDFDQVDWGTITPGLTKVLSGDLVFDTAHAPTVMNTGNHGMGVGVRFSPLVQQGVAGPKEIREFDVAFGKSPSTLQWIDPIVVGPETPNGVYDPETDTTAVQFDDHPDRVLCANEVGKLDLSIHPPASLPSGTYVGEIAVLARAVVGVCQENYQWHEFDGNGVPEPPDDDNGEDDEDDDDNGENGDDEDDEDEEEENGAAQ